jgi:WD40 repeat protein
VALCAARADANSAILDVFSASNGDHLLSLTAESIPTRIMHLPDPDLLAVSTLGGRIIIWQLSSGEELRRLSAGAQADEVAVMPAMDRAVTRAGRSMRVWNTKTGEEISARLTEGSQILHMTISPDGTHVAYGVPRSVEDQTDTARHAIEIWRVDDHAVQTIPLAERPSAIAFDQGGQRLIAVVSEAEIRLWDVETGRQLAVVEPRPDGRFGSRIGFLRRAVTFMLKTGSNEHRTRSCRSASCLTSAPMGQIRQIA